MRRSQFISWGLAILGMAVLVGYYAYGARPDAGAAQAGEILALKGPKLELTIAGEANGKVVIQLFQDVAPQHVARITRLADNGEYDGVVFHRVIDGFMAQTGDVQYGQSNGDISLAGRGGSDLPDVPAEFSDISFDRGIVGMARSSDPDSANSQFFIMFAPATSLNGKYTVVGQVIEGMDVVDAIKRGTGGNGAVVGVPDMMLSARVIE